MNAKNHQGSIIVFFWYMSFYENSSIHPSDELFLQTTRESNHDIYEIKRKEGAPCVLCSFGTLEMDGYQRLRSSFDPGFKWDTKIDPRLNRIGHGTSNVDASTFSTEPKGGAWIPKFKIVFKRKSRRISKSKRSSPRLGVGPCIYSLFWKFWISNRLQSEPSMWRHLRGMLFWFFWENKMEICGWDTSAGSLKNFKNDGGLIFSAGGSQTAPPQGGSLLEFEIQTPTFLKVLPWRHLRGYFY